MDFLAVIQHARVALQREGRITYRTLKRQFDLDDEALDDLTYELIEGQEVAADKDGKMLVWTGSETTEQTTSQTTAAPELELPSPAPSVQQKQETPISERRQLTVMFCDLVGSTALSAQLDPEELQTVVRTYQEVSAQVIERYDGYIAQYLGDGLLVYFGYPAAHEDDAARAVRAGLEIVAALHQARDQFPQPVQVRIGIHTGPVVVGQMGGGSRHEQLALGETPNIAARVQGKAQPDEVVISAATQRLLAGLFEVEDQGLHELKGISTPQPLYRVTAESPARSRFEIAVQAGLTPLVGRDLELGVLRERWSQAQAGNGQAVLVSGEPGVGKSRLVQELKAQVTQDGAALMEFRCSPYHQNSTLYPITEHLQRLLQFASDDTPQTKLAKLKQMLDCYRFPQADTLSLFAALLSLPHPEGAQALTVSPQKQRELTQAAFVAWLIEETEQQPVHHSWEDLHWADPSTLEVLSLLLDQVPTTRLFAVLTFRPEFIPPWATHSYLSQLTLHRLGHSQVAAMVERVSGGKALPKEVIEQIVTKTDGVPLFVEELTKMVMESDFMREVNGHYELAGPLPPLAIPSTLQDSLMARLDRLAPVKEVAQLGATIGREFSYELLHFISPMNEAVLQQALQQLVAVELVFQRGLPPQARYVFKHALIQDTAYASLLKSRRQRLHQQVAQVLIDRFSETADTQPELVAYHYTEAGLGGQATPYWQLAGERATQRSAHVEAIRHLTKGLEVLQALPDTPERAQQELPFQISLGQNLMANKGFGAPEVEDTYVRARELCQQIGETSQLFPTLLGLCTVYEMRGELRTAHELEEQVLHLAQQVKDPEFLVWAHYMLGDGLFWMGEFVPAHTNVEQSILLYDTQEHLTPSPQLGGFGPQVASSSISGLALWHLGYPDQALQRCYEALTRAQKLANPFSIATASQFVAVLHQYRREASLVQERAQASLTLSQEQGFPLYSALGLLFRGWALAMQEQEEAGIAQIRQGLAAWRASGAEVRVASFFALLADAYLRVGQAQEGLAVITEALSLVERNDEHFVEAELYRLKGELLLSEEHGMMKAERQTREAEACFRKALNVARHQQAKSLELRTATSLTRLWQQQGKKNEAHELLAPVYNWFTEGFDTKDLKDAKALLEKLL